MGPEIEVRFKNVAQLGPSSTPHFIFFSDLVYPELNLKEESDLLQVPLHHHLSTGTRHGNGTGSKGSRSGSGRSSNAPPPTPWVPPLWKQQYENIRKMREGRNAPVDTHGCFMLAEKDVPPEVMQLEIESYSVHMQLSNKSLMF